jgi:simple sugar transport system ATP-binding protein
MALLFISSELAEVCRDSHRIVVLRDRRKIAELTGEEIQLERIMHIIADEQPTEEAEDRTDA